MKRYEERHLFLLSSIAEKLTAVESYPETERLFEELATWFSQMDRNYLLNVEPALCQNFIHTICAKLVMRPGFAAVKEARNLFYSMLRLDLIPKIWRPFLERNFHFFNRSKAFQMRALDIAMTLQMGDVMVEDDGNDQSDDLSYLLAMDPQLLDGSQRLEAIQDGGERISNDNSRSNNHHYYDDDEEDDHYDAYNNDYSDTSNIKDRKSDWASPLKEKPNAKKDSKKKDTKKPKKAKKAAKNKKLPLESQKTTKSCKNGGLENAEKPAGEKPKVVEQILQQCRQFFDTQSGSTARDRNIGIALLDLDGRFLYLCKKSQNLFGVRHMESRIDGLFDLMIPFSKNNLVHRFGTEIFSENKMLMASRQLSYVIYSRTALRDFLRSIRKKKSIHSSADFRAKMEALRHCGQKGRQFYFAFLKSLSSVATIVNIKYTIREIAAYFDTKNIYKRNAGLLSKHADRVYTQSQDFFEGGETENLRRRLGFHDRDLSDCLSQSSHNEVMLREIVSDQGRAAREPVEQDQYDEILTKKVILLRTRFSRRIPGYDFSKLVADPQFRDFEDYLRIKLKFNREE